MARTTATMTYSRGPGWAASSGSWAIAVGSVSLAVPKHPEQRQQHEDPAGHVGAVEPGQDEEAGPEQVRPDRQPCLDEPGELIDLTRDEGHPQQRGGHQPHPQLAVVAPLDRRQC